MYFGETTVVEVEDMQRYRGYLSRSITIISSIKVRWRLLRCSSERNCKGHSVTVQYSRVEYCHEGRERIFCLLRQFRFLTIDSIRMFFSLGLATYIVRNADTRSEQAAFVAFSSCFGRDRGAVSCVRHQE